MFILMNYPLCLNTNNINLVMVISLIAAIKLGGGGGYINN